MQCMFFNNTKPSFCANIQRSQPYLYQFIPGLWFKMLFITLLHKKTLAKICTFKNIYIFLQSII